MDKIKNGNTANRAGRPKGAQNKTTKAAKDAIEYAAQQLGGGERLYEWALEDPINEKVFWSTIYPKLIPIQVSGDQDNPLTMLTKVEFAVVKPTN
jgi:hypothetical protein